MWTKGVMSNEYRVLRDDFYEFLYTHYSSLNTIQRNGISGTTGFYSIRSGCWW
jgi:hypothetical protein